MPEWEEETQEKNKTFVFFIKGLKTLWQLMEREQKNIIFVIILMIITCILQLGATYLLKPIFDKMPVISETKAIPQEIVWLIILMFLIKLAELFLRQLLRERKFLKSIINLENFWPVKAQSKLLELSLGYHERENTGKKISKINKGCEKLVNILAMLYWGILPQLFFLVLNIVVILIIDWRLSLVVIVPMIPIVWLVLKIQKKFSPKWKKWEIKKEEANGVFCQSIINVFTVQGFVQEEKEKERLSIIRNDMRQLDLKFNFEMQKYFFWIGLIMNLPLILTLIISFAFIANGYSTWGTVVYIIATGNATIHNLMGIMNDYIKIMRDMIAVVRMKELLDEEPDIKNYPNAVIPQKIVGNIQFQSVSFSYNGNKENVLKNINLKLQPNQMIALVARTGGGKTTIAKLLSRMTDIQKGEILLDGTNIKKIDLFWYRKLFAVVKQGVDIFDGTIWDNVIYPNIAATKSQITTAIRAAHLDVVLDNKNKFPNGLKTQVGERGVILSGGEQQRVGIARAYLALLHGARILILDEATSNLDTEAERAIQNMIAELRQKKEISIMAIAHRLSTIDKSDLIYVIEGGKIVDSGNHVKLMARNGLYAKLVKMQEVGELRE